jgi:hypothetical protein
MGRVYFRLPSPGCPRRIYSIPVNIFASYDHHHCDRDPKYLPCRTIKGAMWQLFVVCILV